jgi:alginate O-acetyltransferase complex protein AlgI
MLFSSYDFVFLYLPIVILTSVVWVRIISKTSLIYFLLFSSLLFYAWSDFSLLFVIGISIFINLLFGKLIFENKNKLFLIAAIAFNLGLLGYFKYSNFFIENIANLFSISIGTLQIALPLGISFFTFQQIAYQVDIYKGITKPASFFRYALFVSFFPQLIAGPIVHYKKLLPQLQSISITRSSIAAGTTLFIVGLSKKVLIADKLAPLVNYYFNGIGEDSFSAGFFDTWLAVLAYSFQLYFDFSGYSDMALGITLCFSIVLPINFFSPYKAISLTQFWRQWHITLSDFLREYVYIPLGGNKDGKVRQVQNILLTMLLGGIWHGAGWNFILWGALSGFIMGAERLTGYTKLPLSKLVYVLKIGLTFLVITLLWVLFRADSVESALHIYSILLGHSDTFLGNAIFENQIYGSLEKRAVAIVSTLLFSQKTSMILLWVGALIGCMIIVFAFPNTAQIFKGQLNTDEHYSKLTKRTSLINFTWRPNAYWLVTTCFLMLCTALFMKRQAEFLYFQF